MLKMMYMRCYYVNKMLMITSWMGQQSWYNKGSSNYSTTISKTHDQKEKKREMGHQGKWRSRRNCAAGDGEGEYIRFSVSCILWEPTVIDLTSKALPFGCKCSSGSSNSIRSIRRRTWKRAVDWKWKWNYYFAESRILLDHSSEEERLLINVRTLYFVHNWFNYDEEGLFTSERIFQNRV